MDSRPMFNHLHHPDRTFPQISSSLDPASRTMITLTQSRGSSLIPVVGGRSLPGEPELDITPPSAMDDDEFHSNSDDDCNKVGNSPGGLSPGSEEKKKYPDYCRTLKIKGKIH